MAGPRRPGRASANGKKVKYDVHEDVDLPDAVDDNVSPREATDLGTESDQGEFHNSPDNSDESSPSTSMVGRKRKRSPPKKSAEAEAAPVVIKLSDDEDNLPLQPAQRKVPRYKLNLPESQGNYFAQNIASALPQQSPPRKILKLKLNLSKTQRAASAENSMIADSPPVSGASKASKGTKATTNSRAPPKPAARKPAARKPAAKKPVAKKSAVKKAAVENSEAVKQADGDVVMADVEVTDADDESEDDLENPVDPDDEDNPKSKGPGQQVKMDNYSYGEGIRQGRAPTPHLEDMFFEMVKKFLMLMKAEKVDVIEKMLRLKAATVCSGTDIPILVLQTTAKYLHQLQTHDEESFTLLIEHLFSAEIVPWKQAYIQRNFNPPALFRDITDFFKQDDDGVYRATTAFGSRQPVPGGLDILVAGFCCVDFSVLNVCTKTLDSLGKSGETFHAVLAYAKIHRPKIIILENVIGAPWKDASLNKNLRKNALAKAVKDAFAELLAEMELEEPERFSKLTKDTKAALKQEVEESQAEILRSVDNRVLGRGIDHHLSEIGYASAHMLVDTKDYGIPQTRQRGYLVAIDKLAFRKTMPGATDQQFKEATDDALSKWKELMKKFENPACVPVEAMLVAAQDDRQPAQSRVEELNFDKAKITAWVKCKLNHSYYRALNRLGDERPLTNWCENGFRKIAEHCQPMKGMTDRVADVQDISHLRCIVRGLDDRYYSRHLDLSQNVYRIQDTAKNGIIGCVTPNGIPYWTYKGRRISGREALVMQGLPVNMLDLSHLTDANLQNLSGNAMTSTVVAAAMFSALIAFHTLLDFAPGPDPSTVIDQEANDEFASVPGLLHNDINPMIAKMKLSVDEAKSNAAKSVSLCHCEGRHGKLDKLFLRCTVCKYTGCIECSGNPTHSFESITRTETHQRALPSCFEKILQKSLPTKIVLSQVGDIVKAISKKHPNAGSVSWGSLEKCYMAAVSSVLLLKQISRREIWEVIYESPESKLVLSISGKQVQWRLYALAAVEKDDQSNDDVNPWTHALRLYLAAHPIARLNPVGDDITSGNWEFFVPHHQLVDATITSSGSLIPSYESSIGLEDHENQYVFDRCSVALQSGDSHFLETDIIGDYEAHRQCGQAFGSLHIKSSTKNDPIPLHFFLDHTQQRGDPWRHQYVFTRDPQRQQPLEYREVTAQLAPIVPFPEAMENSPEVARNLSWRQPKIRHELTCDGESRYSVRVSSATDPNFETFSGSISSLEIIDRVKVEVPGYWVSSGLSIQPRIVSPVSIINYQHIMQANPSTPPGFLMNDSCRDTKTVFVCQAAIPAYTALKYPRNEIITMDHTNQVRVTSDLLWLLQPVLSIPGYTVDFEQWHDIDLVDTPLQRHRCAPRRPQIFWVSVIRGKSMKQEPYEDPEQAAVYEKSLKSRPTAINFQFLFGIEGVTVKISVNFMTLVHRAIFDLEPSGNMSGINASISLVTDDCIIPLDSFTPFIFPNSRKMQKNPEVDDITEFKKYQLPGKLKLRPEQCRSVAWQVNQERNRPGFLEEVVVEEQSRTGYRASAKVSRTKGVSGGMLFHPVGFGKTAVVLGLISHQQHVDEAWAQQSPSTKEFSGRIPTKATLILVPRQLIHQWAEEVRTFLEPKFSHRIVVIKTIAQVKSLTIEACQEAWIVIMPSHMFEHATYIEILAQFAGMVGLDLSPSPRAYSTFHEAATGRVAKNLDILRQTPSRFQNLVDQQIYQNIEDIKKNQKPVPSRRLVGCAYQTAAGRPGQPDKVLPKAGTEVDYVLFPKGPPVPTGKARKGKNGSWESSTGVPVEIFAWARVVVDEFPYMPENVGSALRGLVKKSLWLVSATPRLDDFETVRQIATYFDINLGIKDYTLMEDDVMKNELAGMTVLEKLQAFESRKSTAWYDQRIKKAQDFINLCAICDEPSYDQIKFCEIIKVSQPPAAQLAAAKELMQCLAVTQKGTLPHKPPGSSNQALQIAYAFTDTKTAVQALMKQAAFFDNDTDPTLQSYAVTNGATSAAVNLTCQSRTQSLVREKHNFTSPLQRILWLYNHREAGNGAEKWQTFLARLRSRFWGDDALCNELLTFISIAENTGIDASVAGRMAKAFPKGATASNGGKSQPAIQAKLRDEVKDLTKVADEILKAHRGLRFMQSVETCQRQAYSPTLVTCNSCRTEFEVKDITVLTGCGHMICNVCLDRRATCPAQGCKSGRESYRLTPGSLFATRETNDINFGEQVYRFGQKAADMVQLILKIPKDEKILLFVQSAKADEMMNKVQQMLNARHITSLILSHAKNDASAVLTKFQKNQGRTQVLILNIDDESAAGCNLAMASRVIFFGPYWTTGSSGQSLFDATMKQAIGRAVRYGQKAPLVKVYHFMTAYTVDVDIFEFRNKKVVVKTGNSYKARERHGRTHFGEFASCVPHLVHAPQGGFQS